MAAVSRSETIEAVSTTGGIVLVDERKPELSYRLLQQRSRASGRALCITREPPERVARRHPIPNADHYWLITNGGEKCVDPYDLSALRHLVDGFVNAHEESAVLIDGVELLMIMNSYEAVRTFLSGLQSSLVRGGVECVIPIDTRTLTSAELAEFRTTFPMVRGAPSE